MILSYVDSFRNHASFHGRTSRKDFWSFALIHFLVIFLILLIGRMYDVFTFYLAYVLLSAIPAFAICQEDFTISSKVLYGCLLVYSFWRDLAKCTFM